MIIYLDFDGVLHPDAVYQVKNKPLELRAPGELFMHTEILLDALAPYPEANIILSTSWVRSLGFDRTVKKMPAKLGERVLGSTWHKVIRQDNYDPFSYMSRYKQIMLHVNKNAIGRWIAIDDLFSGSEDWPAEHISKLVLTEESKGLSCKEAQADLNKKLMETNNK